MRSANLLHFSLLITLLLLTATAGCRPAVDDEEHLPVEPTIPVEPLEPAPEPEPEPEPEPAPPPTIPEVSLTESLRATCLVAVDDQVPDGELTDLEGQTHSIVNSLGEKLTVLFFWHSGNMHSVVQLEDLARDFAGPLAEQGGRIVAVNVADTAEKAAEVAKNAKADFLILLDPERTYFGKLATERLPRTYVLDAEGTILWFDLEYSRSTRRHLEQTIEVVMAEETAP